MKKVSIIIPCYNQGKYLEETVNSVLCSHYKNFEIIIVNDGSDDEITKLVLNKLENKGITIINIENSGVCSARNTGIKSCNGEYILTLDADDKIAPDYIEKAVKILDENDDIGIVYCKAQFFDAVNKPVDLKPATIYNMLVQNRIFSASFFRKSTFTRVGGFNPDLELGCEDWDFWLSIIETGAKVYQIPEILFFWRKAENFRTQKALNPSNHLQIRLKMIKQHKKLYNKFGIIIYVHLFIMIIKNYLSYHLKSLKGGAE